MVKYKEAVLDASIRIERIDRPSNQVRRWSLTSSCDRPPRGKRGTHNAGALSSTELYSGGTLVT